MGVRVGARVTAEGISRVVGGRGCTAIIALTVALALTACSSSSAPKPAGPPSTSALAASAAPGLTGAQGKGICQDIAAWIPQANNEDMPRFSAQLESDESEAGSTALGQDMATLDDNLQAENSLALNSNNYVVTGSPNPITGLSQDCQGYGLTLNWSPSTG